MLRNLSWKYKEIPPIVASIAQTRMNYPWFVVWCQNLILSFSIHHPSTFPNNIPWCPPHQASTHPTISVWAVECYWNKLDRKLARVTLVKDESVWVSGCHWNSPILRNHKDQSKAGRKTHSEYTSHIEHTYTIFKSLSRQN